MQNPYDDPWNPNYDGNNNQGENPSGGETPPSGTPKDCGQGYTWEPDPNGNPAGRCVVTGTKWEDGCWIDTDGKIYCKDNPKVQSNSSNSTDGIVSTKPVAPPVSRYDDLNSELLNKYRDMYGRNIPAPYDAATIARLEGKAKAVSESTKARQSQQYLAGRSAMGLGNTGRTKQGIRNIAMEADAAMGQQAIDINHAAIKANYQAEVANIERQLSSLNSMSQFAVALASNETQRQSIQNSYSIQIMQLKQQLEELKLKIIMGAY